MSSLKNFIEEENSFLVPVIIFLLVAILFWDTGIISDEVSMIRREWATTKSMLAYFTLIVPYNLVQDKYIFIYDIIKIFYSFISIYFLTKLLGNYYKLTSAYLISTVVILFPLHDGANFWLLGQHVVITFGIISLALYLCQNNRKHSGFLVAIVGCFHSYASPIYSAGMTVVILWEKKFKLLPYFIIPQLLFSGYYVYISITDENAPQRLLEKNILGVLKTFFLQLVSYIDLITFSFLFKFYYLILENNIFNCILALLFSHFCFVVLEKEKLNINLLILFSGCLFSGLSILALTGGFFQTAFGLTTRIVFPTTLILAYVLIFLSKSVIYRYSIFFFLFLTLFGMSSHWKNWNQYQKEISAELNFQVNDFENPKRVYLYGETYSKIGGVSHLPLTPVYDPKKVQQTIILNRRLKIDNDTLLDLQKGTRERLANQYYVFDTENNLLKQVDTEELDLLISQAAPSFRHWSQTLSDENWIKQVVLYLKPSLAHER